MSEAEKMRDYPIKKANEMVQKCMFMLTAQEFDLLQYIVMKIKDDVTELKPMEISIKEFCEITNIKYMGGKTYENIKSSLKSLSDKSIWYEDDVQIELVRWINKPKIQKDTGTVIVQLDEFWTPFLLQLKERYNVTTLRDTLPMKSVYGKRMYELLNSYVMDDKKSYFAEFTVEELKRILLGDKWNKIYKEFKSFNLKVLKPALRDLESYGNLDVEMTLKRFGRSYKYIYFNIKYKDPLERSQAFKNSEEFFDKKKAIDVDHEVVTTNPQQGGRTKVIRNEPQRKPRRRR